MAKNTMSFLFTSLVFYLFVQSQAHGHGRVAPAALYVFGDSVMDPGNNIFLNTPVKVNFTPYGIDFAGGPTGRFTNGYTIADFWYKWSNKGSQEPIPLPYMHPLSKQKSGTNGLNYASGTAGILPDTNRNLIRAVHCQDEIQGQWIAEINGLDVHIRAAHQYPPYSTVPLIAEINGLDVHIRAAHQYPPYSTGENLPLGEQVKLFKETTKQYLPSLEAYNNRAKLSNALSKSIFVICMGSNDYVNYLQPGSNTSKLYNAEQFGEFLVNQLGNHLKKLYNLGARKFVVFEIAPLGCLPDVIDKTKPSTLCDEQINGLVSIFNTNLGVKLNELKSMLNGSTFVTAKSYRFIHNIIHNPLHHGFTDSSHPCCASKIDGSRDCKPGTVPCQNRRSYVFWDKVHPTQAIYKQIASKCFNGKGLCSPLNVVQLAGKH